jgi:hypothetical protein
MVTGMFYLHFITQQITGHKTNIAGEKAIISVPKMDLWT